MTLPPPDQAFARWANVSCPPVVEILRTLNLALTGRPARDLDGGLDDLGRRLFAVPREDAGALGERFAALLTDDPGFAVDEVTPEGLLLDAVLERRAGHPQLLAVVLAEAGRRAGITTGVVSSPGCWYVAVTVPGHGALLIAPGDPVATRPPSRVRRHCGHELALGALLGLRRRYLDCGDAVRAEHASSLLLWLGFDAEGTDRGAAAADPLRVLWA